MGHDEEPELTAAEQAYAELLEEEAGDFESLCAAHPALADELRRIRERYEQFRPHAQQLLEGSLFGSGSEQAAPTSSSVLDLRAGETIGDYRLIGRIGEGGMGQVWEAEQLSLGRRVALKFIRSDALSSRHAVYFEREARAGGRLNHPGIVMLYDHGNSEGLAWIAMELVGGGRSLWNLIQEGKSGIVPRDHDRQVARFIREVALAMQAAHEAGVIHRDLTPRNVLISEDGSPKVTDFGPARILDESALSRTGDRAGTFSYMSPEQVDARGTAIDHRTDVFSLGVILYEMLTARRPFEGDTSQQICHQITKVDPPSPETIRSRIPRDLAVICGKALEKVLGQRYRSMQALADDLGRFLDGEPIAARPAGPLRKALAWARRRPARAAGMSGLVVGLALIVVGLGWVVTGIRDVYTTATEARSLEEEGALPEAAGKWNELLGLPFLEYSPGSGDDRDRAAQFCYPGTEFANLCHDLGRYVGSELEDTHVRLQRLLLTPGKMKPSQLRLVIRFLVAELRKDGEDDDPHRRRLAAETVGIFLMIRPLLFKPKGEVEFDAEPLRELLVAIATNKENDENIELRRLAASALSGMSRFDNFHQLIELMGSDDLELQRIATQSTIRLWYQALQEDLLVELPPNLLRRWIEATVEAAEALTSEDPLETLKTLDQICLFVSWTRLVQQEAYPGDQSTDRHMDWSGLSDSLVRYLVDLEAALSSYREHGRVPRVTGIGGNQGGLADKREDERVSYCKRHLEKGKTSHYAYENIWDTEALIHKGKTPRDPENVGEISASEMRGTDQIGKYGTKRTTSLATVSFAKRGSEPIRGGLARRATWEGAKPWTDNPDRERGFFFEFGRPGESRLSLFSAVPERARGATITLDHQYAMRYFLPSGGRAKVRVSAGERGPVFVLDVPRERRGRPLSVSVDGGVFAGKEELEVSVELVSATTTYRLYSLGVEFWLPPD